MKKRTGHLAIILFVAVLILPSFIFLSYGDSSPNKVYFTDFESVTKKNLTSLNMGIDNYFDFDGSDASMFIDDGTLRPDSPVPHSGNRAVCMEVNSGYRSEFNLINMQNVVTNELFVSVWLYLPADFRLHMASENWFELANPMFTGQPSYAPYFGISLLQASAQPPFDLMLYQRDINNVPSTLQTVPNVDLPRGRWFNLQYYVYRDETNGVIRVWLDDPTRQNEPIVSASGLHMINPDVTNWFTTIAKIYHDILDTASYRLWVDDLEVWNGLPAPPINGNVWTDKGDNSKLPIAWGCLGSYKQGSNMALFYSVNDYVQGKLDIINPAGTVTTLINGTIAPGKYSLEPMVSALTGYWNVNFRVSTNNKTGSDGFQFCVVEDYVTFTGELLSFSRSPSTGELYYVKINNIISDPTGQMKIGKTITVSWNYSLTKISEALQQGSYVEIHGGYTSSAVGSSNEVVYLANSDDYIKQVSSYAIFIDPNGGRVYIDDSSDSKLSSSSYQWVTGSVHKIFAEPLSASGEKTIFSKWTDGNTSNPRTILVTGPASYTALWSSVPDPVLVSVSLLSPRNETFAVNDLPLTLSVSGPATWIGYSLDSGAEVTIAQNTTLKGLRDGTHSIIVYVKGENENVVNASDIVWFTIDTNPQLRTYDITIDPNGGKVYIDEASEPITIQTTYAWPQNSSHKIYAVPTSESPNYYEMVFLKWEDGNQVNPRNITVTDAVTYTALWNSAPSTNAELQVFLLSPRNETINLSDVDLTIEVAGAVSWMGYSIDGRANVTVAGNTTIYGLSKGTHTIVVYAMDFYAKTVGSGSIQFTIKPNETTNYWITGISAAVIAAAGGTAIVLLVKFRKIPQKIRRLFKREPFARFQKSLLNHNGKLRLTLAEFTENFSHKCKNRSFLSTIVVAVTQSHKLK
jgi:hypothetical protein